MKIQVLVEPLNGTGFRATGGEPFSMTAEGSTREEALDQLKAQFQARLKVGAEVVEIDLGPPAQHPALKFAGIFKGDDPWIQEWQREVEEFRNQVDADGDRP